MFGNKDGKWSLRVVVIGLYLLLLVSVVQTVLVLYLYASRSVDAAACASLVLAFVSAQLSLIFIALHAFLARRGQAAFMHNYRRSTLSSICRFLPRVLIMLWMVTAAVGIIVAARQPKCLSRTFMQNLWQGGITCRLHRAIVAMTLSAFVAICVIFSSIEVSKQPYDASIFGILQAVQDNNAASERSLSSCNSLVREKRATMAPSIDLEAATSNWALWLQRRNSVSTRPAACPSGLRRFPQSISQSPFPQSQSSIHGSPSTGLVPSRTLSFSSTRTPSPSELGMFGNQVGPSRALSAVSSISRSSSSTSIRRSPLSTMRRVSEPEIPIIPPQFLEPQDPRSIQRRPTLPCSWSPALKHAPLSADPAIRAFSSETVICPSTSTGTCATVPQASRSFGGKNLSVKTGIRMVSSSEHPDPTCHGRPRTPRPPVQARNQERAQDATLKSVTSTKTAPTTDDFENAKVISSPACASAVGLNIRKTRPISDGPRKMSDVKTRRVTPEPAHCGVSKQVCQSCKDLPRQKYDSSHVLSNEVAAPSEILKAQLGGKVGAWTKSKKAFHSVFATVPSTLQRNHVVESGKA